MGSLSGHYPFIVDSGYDCSEGNHLGDYLTTDIVSTRTCVGNKIYYLASVPTPMEGSATTCSGCGTGTGTTVGCGHCDTNRFTTPPGLEAMDYIEWGGASLQEIVAG